MHCNAVLLALTHYKQQPNMYNCQQSLLARRCTHNDVCRLQAEGTFETHYKCWTTSIDKSCIIACCHDTCLPNAVRCCRRASGCTSGKGQLAPSSTSRGCQVCTTKVLLLLLGQAKSPLLPLPQIPHPLEMILQRLRLRPAVSHGTVATGLLLLLAQMRPCPPAEGLLQVSLYPVARQRPKR